jgi:hypothetical protein
MTGGANEMLVDAVVPQTRLPLMIQTQIETNKIYISSAESAM